MVNDSTNPAAEAELYGKIDASSFSNCTNAIVTHSVLTYDIDFENKSLSGIAEHNVKILVDGTKVVIFDSSKLSFNGSEVELNGSAVKYEFAKEDPALGTKITVHVPEQFQGSGSSFSVKFTFTVGAEASAVQWLDAAATKGKKHPFMFTQCQAIHARTLLPCMDTPGVKATFSATITAPKWCTVLMSALSLDSITSPESEKNTFFWHQPVPVPSYLIALAAGNLESREISKRVRVWSEPEVVEAAHYEFAETEDFLKAAEKLTECAYMWSRYDVLCLPPSFPYGGMENPCLTFATPTLLAGDRSLADVIAHEIAHSWTGNLITNHTWAHFWLNEGWTVWLERKIISMVRGSGDHGKLSAQIGWKHLTDDVSHFGAENGFTRLVWPLAGEDPDDAFSGVPYEKGFNLLTYLENLVGTAHFEVFAKYYIQKFQYATITTGEFRDTFLEFFSDLESLTHETSNQKNNRKSFNKSKINKIQALDWTDMFLSPGLPKYTPLPDFSNPLSVEAQDLAKKWIECAEDCKSETVEYPDAKTAEIVQSWTTPQKNLFLEYLLNHAQEKSETTESTSTKETGYYCLDFLLHMDELYNFTTSGNAEVKYRWQMLCIQSNAPWILVYVKEFLASQGRMKFVRPLYRALRQSFIGKKAAVDTFEKYKDIYHPIARKMIASDLKKADEAEMKKKTVLDTVTDSLAVGEVDSGTWSWLAPAAIIGVAVASASAALLLKWSKN